MPPTLVDPTRQPSDIPPNDHLVISVVRNESLRLPYFLSYYRTIGFKHFIMIDNDSDDGTREFLLEQPDVVLFHTADSFGASGFGSQWMSRILDSCSHDRWILAADADELLMWPGGDRESIQDLTARLDQMRAGGLFTIVVDMYSDKPFGEIGYVRGEPFLTATPFFDRGPYELVEVNHMFPYRLIYGGPRVRTFLQLKDGWHPPPAGSNLPFLRWQRGQKLGIGAHLIEVPVALAPMRGALLHFKMFDNMPERCIEEVARGEHYAGAREYRALGLAIEQAPNRSFFDPQYSVRYSGPDQLVALGVMHDKDPFGDLPM